MPVRRFTTQIEGEATNAVVRVIISEEHADVRVSIYLAGSKGRADPRVAAANDSYVHKFLQIWTNDEQPFSWPV
jgi:hypothetical protein